MQLASFVLPRPIIYEGRRYTTFTDGEFELHYDGQRVAVSKFGQLRYVFVATPEHIMEIRTGTLADFRALTHSNYGMGSDTGEAKQSGMRKRGRPRKGES